MDEVYEIPVEILMYAHIRGTRVFESSICMSLTPSVGSSFEFISFRAIAFFCPTHPRLYIASYLDSHSSSMPPRHESFSSAGARPGAHLGLLMT